jgi:rod shape determining protein RodA
MIFRKIDKKFFSQVDWLLFFITLLLSGISLMVLHSAGFDPDLGESPSMKRQAIYFLIGFGAFIVCMVLSTSFWRRSSFFFYIIACLLLAAIMVAGVSAGGATRWLAVGPFRVQPSEFVKLAVILALARILSSENAPKDGYTVLKLWAPSAILFLPALLILRQPDLGTAISVLLIGGSMLMIAGIKWGTLIRLTILCIALIIPTWQYVMKDYQRQRVLTFLAPEQDPLGSGYHAIQSKIAVGSGALFGKGFLQGTQTQLRFLPEQTTDFIFSVLAEEWGFFGSMVALSLYCLLIIRLLNTASQCEEPFASFVAVGVAAMVFWHVVVNIGMVIGIMPVVGITLALLSYGGSSVITIMASLGIVAGFSIRRFMFG